MVILLIAKVRSLILRADCHRLALSAWFVLGLKEGIGNPQRIGKLVAKELLFLWQILELECWSWQLTEIQPLPSYLTSRDRLFEAKFASVKLMCGALLRPKLWQLTNHLMILPAYL
jgi:hypothetical protein